MTAFCEHGNELSGFRKESGLFFENLNNYQLSME
jgi:hypothetical protein